MGTDSTKVIKMKRIFGVLLLVTLYAFVFPIKTFSQTAYAEYKSNTLTFKYGTKPNNGNAWSIDDYSYLESPGWFSQCSNISKVVFDSSFSSARPKTCRRWFQWCENLTQIEGMSYFNTSETTDMSQMFYMCLKLESIDLSEFETYNVTDMNMMFQDCQSLTNLNLATFNTWYVQDMSMMFGDCNNLRKIEFGDLFNTSCVTEMIGMFWGCSSLKRLDLSSFNTRNVESMNSMFHGCTSLYSIDLSSFNTSKVSDFSWMFKDCNSINRIDIHSFNISGQLHTLGMFQNCSSLEKIICDGDWSGVSESTNMFSGCTNLVGAIPYNSEKVTAAYANKTTGYFSPFYYYIAEVSSDYNTLTFRRSATAPNGTTQWDATRSGFKEDLWLPDWWEDDTYNPPYTFHGLGVRKVIFDESFKDARPNSCYEWFVQNGSLEEIEGIEYLNTSEIVSMSKMFILCSGLKSIDLRNFILSDNVEDISQMFSDCYNLETIICDDDWSDKQCLSSYMFKGCSSLVGVISYNSSKVTASYANPSTGYFTSSANYKVDLTVPSYGICTYSSTYDLDFTNVEGLTAYVISDFNASAGTLTLTPATSVKAGEGLLLKGDAGEYAVPRTTTDATYTNYLVGVPTTTSVSPTDGDYTNFVLADGKYGVNFYALSKTGNISAGKAYLRLPTADINQVSQSRGFSFIDGGTTSIQAVRPSNYKEGVFFDLQGRRVNNPSKGLYIMNGKKVIIK